MGTDAACVDDRVVGSVSVHRCRRVHLWVDPSSLVFGEGVDVVPEGFAGDVGGTRATFEAVVFSFGSPRWWQRWPLLFHKGGTDMATDAAGDTAVPLCWG
jgi:hypothetical protein